MLKYIMTAIANGIKIRRWLEVSRKDINRKKAIGSVNNVET